MTRSIKIALLAAVAMLSLVATSCRSGISENDAPIVWSDEIEFDVRFAGEWNDGNATKSAAISERIASVAIGRDTLHIDVAVEPNRQLPAGCIRIEQVAETEELAADSESHPTDPTATDPTATDESRGAAITTATLSEYFVTAALSSSSMYFEDLPMTPTSKTGKFWPADQLSFMAYSPEEARPSSFSAPASRWEATFTYTMPVPAGTNDAVSQPDYVYCLKPEAAKSSEAIDLTFHHAFAALKFKTGDIPENMVVKSISLKGIYSTATCTFYENAGDLAFDWSGHSNTSKNYVQAFDKSVTDGEAINSATQTFMVVPQELPAAAVFQFDFTVNGRAYSLSKTFQALNILEWEADKVYTYTLNINDEVEIDVSSEVSNDYTICENPQITNNGLTSVYLRAAIVGCWEKEIDGEWQSITPWNDNNLATPVYGIFDWGTSWGTYWVKHTDGFYYYKQILPRNASVAAPLFVDYELQQDPPALNAELRIHIIVQAVVANNEGKAQWSYLSTLFP